MKHSNKYARKCAVSPTARSCRTLTTWHLGNEYIPDDVLAQMAELGVFSLTIPEEFGGMGLGKKLCALSRKSFRAATSA